MAEQQAPEAWKAPYVSYQTLSTFIDEKLGQNPLPPRIDRGFLDNYAGSIQAQLLATLRTMGMVSDAGLVLPPLREAVRGPEQRKQVIRSWAEDFYKEQLALAEQTATAQMLHESFAGQDYTGSTLRKAVVFFLALAEDVNLPRSPHFKPPRQSVGSRSTRRKSNKPSPAANPPPGGSVQQAPREEKTVSLGKAGYVTVQVNVRWLELPNEKFMRLRKAIADLEELSEEEPTDEADHG